MSTYEHQQSPSRTPPLEPQRKRRRIETTTSTTSTKAPQILQWRSSTDQQTYSSKLIQALRQVRSRSSNSPLLSGSRAVRDAADKALAIAAKGRTRWSRAILTNRLKLRLRHHKKAKKITAKILPPALPQLQSSTSTGEIKPPALEKRVKVLGRLVPGCRKLSFPNLLDEAADYIAALQMQVRTMAALAQLLSGSPPSLSGPIEPSSSIDNNNNPDDTPVH